MYVLRKGGVQNIDGVRPDNAGNISTWDTLHRYGVNYVPSDTSNAGWNKLGFCIIYYTKNKINNQPTQYGQLINIPADNNQESTQLWIEQFDGSNLSRGGSIWYRAGNGSMPINTIEFKAVATTNEVNDLSSYE